MQVSCFESLLTSSLLLLLCTYFNVIFLTTNNSRNYILCSFTSFTNSSSSLYYSHSFLSLSCRIYDSRETRETKRKNNMRSMNEHDGWKEHERRDERCIKVRENRNLIKIKCLNFLKTT